MGLARAYGWGGAGLAASLALVACTAPMRQVTLDHGLVRAAENQMTPTQEAQRVPVVLVHGIDDTPRVFKAMEAHLGREGFARVSAVTLSPNDGGLPMEALAAQLEAHVEQVRRASGAARVDVVAFSMGALVARVWMLEQDGRHRVRRFVSISGPHAGTATGWLRGNQGATQMRWNSPLLQRLRSDAPAFAPTEVFSLWTPLDLMIVPAHSSRLEGARERTFPVLLHPLMLSDGRVLRAVTEALSVRHARDFATGSGVRAPGGL